MCSVPRGRECDISNRQGVRGGDWKSTETVDGFALGDLVEIRSAEEILAGLDSRGEHDSLQFMPEMLQYCGKTFRIDKIAGKTCDTVNWSGLREMQNTVHLAAVRCDGQAHGGCQAGCLIYWKTSWLKPATGNSVGSGAPGVRTLPIAAVTQPEATPRAACTPQRLAEVAHGGCRPAAEHAEEAEPAVVLTKSDNREEPDEG